MRQSFAVDLGTATTLVYARGRGVVVDEPTVLACGGRRRRILAVGSDAEAMTARGANGVTAQRPVRAGAITDFDAAVSLLRELLRRAGVSRFSRVRVLVCLPITVTDVERRAVEAAVLRAGASRAFLVDAPVAAAVGAGLPVREPKGSMVVDLGGGASQAAILSMGGVVASRAVRTGGEDLDAAIRTHLRQRHGLVVGPATSEAVKRALGSAWPGAREPVAQVRGRDPGTGGLRTVELGAAEVRQAIEEPVAEIVGAVVEVFRDCPPDVARDVLCDGMTVVGGGAFLRGLGPRIAAETGVGVRVVENPRHALVEGAGRTMESPDALRTLVEV